MRKLLLLAASALALLATPAAAELHRRAGLGVTMPPDRQAGAGVTVGEVVPASTAAAIGVRPGDVIVRAGGEAITAPPQLVTYAGTLFADTPVTLTVRREGRETVLTGRAVGRPLERFEGARVTYGAVPFDGGELRDILVMPDGVAAPPVVYLIQGFTCTTMENPDYHRIGEDLIRAGIGYYRVEKAGVGDSIAPHPCTRIDYGAELAGFRAAYRQLVDTYHVPADRIFMFGHSMGGLQAPMLAAETPPRGVAVYGTVLRNWADYHRDMTQFQPFLLAGGDLAAYTEHAEAFREAIRRFYFLRQSPAEVAAADPAYAGGLREFFSWDGGENMFGRHYKFTQDLAHQPLIAAWRDARTNVLSLYGETDVVALFDTDQKVLADFVNALRPGTARYVGLPDTYHGFEIVGNRARLQEIMRANGGAWPQGEFNPEVTRNLIAWIQDSMRQPPVRERFPAAG